MTGIIIKRASVNAAMTVAYIVLIASFLSNAKYIFGKNEGDETVLVPIVMLLLLVISAAITGWCVFGLPVMWYIDGKKKESVTLLAYTLGFLCVIALACILVLAVLPR